MKIKNLQILTLFLFTAISVSAQTVSKNSKSDVKQFFERQRVILKIDMPADKTGIEIDITPETGAKIKDSTAKNRKKPFSISLHKGDRPLITNTIVTAKRIELHLNGGGYDPPTRPEDPGPFEKTEEAKIIREKIKHSTGDEKKLHQADYDKAKKKHDKKKEKYRIDLADYIAYIKGGRLNKGSRFILKFEQAKTSVVTPEEIMNWLNEYVDFSLIRDRPETQPDRIRPYFGKWQNDRGEKIWIETGSLTINQVMMKYREVCSMAAENVFAVEIVKGPIGDPRFIMLKIGNEKIEATFYRKLPDLNNGINSVKKETWSK